MVQSDGLPMTVSCALLDSRHPLPVHDPLQRMTRHWREKEPRWRFPLVAPLAQGRDRQPCRQDVPFKTCLQTLIAPGPVAY